jgi:endonuclease YncB( thermonuclease family)
MIEKALAPPAPWPFDGEIIRWVDGDTVFVKFFSEREVVVDFGFGFKETRVERREFRPDNPVRLYGIDTPETHGPEAKTEKAAGLKAMARAHELAPPGLKVRILSYKDDKYGRYLVQIHVPGMTDSISAILVKEGFAKPYFGGKKE